MNRALRTMALVGLALGVGTALAQGADERAVKLLTPYAATFTRPMVTLDQVFSLTTFDEGGKQLWTWRGRVVADFEKHELAVITLENKKKKDGDEPSEGLIVIRDRVFKVRYGRKEPNVKNAPSQQDSVAKLVARDAFRRFMAIDIANAKHTGAIKYGDLLAGQQVTTVSTDGQRTGVRLVFDERGHILGKVREVDEAGKRHTQITRLEQAAGPGEYAKFGTSRIYSYSQDQATLIAERRIEKIVVDQPVDQAIFNVTMKKK